MLTVSCMGDLAVDESTVQEKVTLTINIGNPATRSTGVTDGADMGLSNWQVLVFKSNGQLEGYSVLYSDGSRQCTLDVIPGSKKIWAVGNVESIFKDLTEEQLRYTISSLGDNSLNKFVMTDFADVDISGDRSLNLSLKHIASKIVIDQITRDFTNKDYSGLNLKIKRIYMGNVVGQSYFDCSGNTIWYNQVCTWYNKLCVWDSEIPAAVKNLICDDNINFDLSEGGSYTTRHTFYVYPNLVERYAHGGSWTPRHTRLVIECDYNGRTCYYPITIPQEKENQIGVLPRNTIFHIGGLTLKRPGSTDPDDPGTTVSSTVAVTFNISVAEWEGESSYTEIFQ